MRIEQHVEIANHWLEFSGDRTPDVSRANSARLYYDAAAGALKASIAGAAAGAMAQLQSSGQLRISGLAANVVPLYIEAASGQTANLTEWRRNGGASAYATVSASQGITVIADNVGSPTSCVIANSADAPAQRLLIRPLDTATRGIMIELAASQVGNAIEVRDSAADPRCIVKPLGSVVVQASSADLISLNGGIASDLPAQRIFVQTLGANTRGMVLFANSTQTVNLFEARNNSDVVMTAIGGDGRMYVKAPNSAVTDGNLPAASFSVYLNEAGNTLVFRAKYTDGTTLKSGTIALT